MLLKAFRERNYRIFFIGQSFSLVGYWIQSTTFNWLLYQFTDSALWLGYLSAAISLPVMLLLPFAGALVDRFNRQRLLMVLQGLFMVQALTLALLTYMDALTLSLIVIMGCVQSMLVAFDGPARQAFVPGLVANRELLPAAISLNSMLFNSSRAIGPPIAGWVMAQTGPAPCFLLNATSYVCIVIALLLIRLSKLPAGTKTAVRSGALDNLRFIAGAAPLRYLLLCYSATATVAMSVYVLLPMWAHEVIGSGPQGLGWLMGGIGLGALLGALIIGTQRTAHRLWPLFRYAGLMLGAALILLFMSYSMWLVLLVTLLLGMAYIAQGVAANTLLQLNIDDQHRAGVMAFYLLAAFGSIPVGNVIGGLLGQWLGLHGAALVGGCAVLLITALFWRTSNQVMAAQSAAPSA